MSRLAAEPRNRGKDVDDMLLLEEMSESLRIITRVSISSFCIPKGQHYSYYQRYTRAFPQSGNLSASGILKTAASRS